MIELPYGLHLEVGDVIIAEHPLATHKFTVSRVTAKFAFVKYNDHEHAEGKFPRIYTYSGFQVLPRDMWDRTSYKVYREVKE
jgi:hypothetical protein